MVRHIRLRYDWLSHSHVPTEEIVKRRVREPVTAGCVIRCVKGIPSNTLLYAALVKVSNVFSAANIA